MKKKLFIFLILLVIIIFSLFLYITTPPKLNCNNKIGKINSILKVVNPVKIVYLNGTGYSRGYQHGTLLKKDIKYMVSVLKNKVGPIVYHLGMIKARKLDRALPKEYRCEMKGIADGAGVNYYDVLLINTFDDLMHLAKCSSAIVLKGVISDNFFFARNLDYHYSELAKENTIFVYKNKNKHSFISVAFPAYAGVLTGFNDIGVCLSIHTSETMENQWGFPTGFLLRKCMENANSLNDVIKIISTAKRCQGNNIMVGSYFENSACVIEYTAKRVGVRFASNNKGFIECTNHFQIEKMKKYNTKILKRSTTRSKYIEEHIKKPFNLENLISIFSHYDGNKVLWTSVANKGTVQAVIFAPDQDLFLIGKGSKPPVNNPGYLKLKLSDLLKFGKNQSK